MENHEKNIQIGTSHYINEEKYLRARKKLDKLIGFYWHLAAYVLVNIFIITMMSLSMDEGYVFFQFSTFSTAFFWGIGLFFHWMGVFGSNILMGNKWEQRKIKELMEDEGRSWE